jgi:hypothetical protein
VRVDLDDQQYAVRFTHFNEHDTALWVLASPLQGMVDRMTICHIFEVHSAPSPAPEGIEALPRTKDGKVLVPTSFGYAFCSRGDQFEKRIGRKMAFTRALERLHLDKATRTKFWQAYAQTAGAGEGWRVSNA